MRILVTGGAGFIGSHLVEALCGEDHDVTVIDNLASGKTANIASTLSEIRFAEGTILDNDLIEAEVKRCDMVFHLAAAVGVRHIVGNPLDTILTNTSGTANVLSSCLRYGKKVVLASSSEVYGKTSKVPMAEDDDRVLGPTTVHRWSYSTSKGIDEHLALACSDRRLPVVIVRYFNCYGPRLDPGGYGSVVANFLRPALAGAPITVFDDGRQTRCFTYVSDTVRGTLAAAFTPGAEGLVINIGTTRETSIAELAELIKARAGSGSDILFTPYESYYGAGFEDTRRRVPDITRATQILGWQPEVDLEDGLDRVIDWWRTALP